MNISSGRPEMTPFTWTPYISRLANRITTHEGITIIPTVLGNGEESHGNVHNQYENQFLNHKNKEQSQFENCYLNQH